MKIISYKILPLLVIALASPSLAAITLIDTGAFATGNNATSYTITSANIGGALDFTGGSKLVVSIGSEASPNNAGHIPTSVTYGGVALTLADSDGANGRASIYYLDDLSASFTGTNFVITYGAAETQNGVGFGAYVLGGTAAGFADSFTSGSATTVNVTTTTSGEFVITSFARNNVDFVQGAASGDGLGAQSPLTELFRTSNPGIGETTWSAASAYALLGAANTYPLTYYENNATGRIIAVTFEAAPIPEPSTALLGSLGLLAILRRRR